ncbi:MAG: Chemotaxis protein CheW [Verrucomicrobiae bacterium]|nr:Chemotaxis protein CheW [Verrucomicrobiae bacterium]
MTEDQQRILKARAQALAQEPVAQATEAMIEVVEFSLATERYAIEISFVREVFPFKELTPVPCTPPFYTGIVNVRGRLIPVVDLKKFFDLPANGLQDLHKVIILHSAEMDLGILADDVGGVRSVSVSQLQAALPTLSGIGQEYLRGVTGDRLVVLDAERILGDPKIVVHEEIEK